MDGRDQEAAVRLAEAREQLLADFASELADRPWLARGVPATDGDLVRLAAWCARSPEVDAEVVMAGVSLLEAARSELDQIEAALLFAARSAGVTWAEVATALGLGSAQAAQQRFDRVLARTDQADTR